ncbi:chemotaxis protein CheB [Anaerolineales bacterium HSG6]|nr:chemotaxis protein CheB [Anaerolineales bacterium HSG6]MDM8530195.1 chemotaxis protein CheB [Anaerolineales bacterium HSG25]
MTTETNKQDNQVPNTQEKSEEISPDKSSENLPTPPDETISIVALGASAGGLEAYEQFFRHTSPETGMAFVLVQHLDPTHKTILGELMQNHTDMKVIQLENDNVKVEPNCVYIIPPNRDLLINNGVLQVTKSEKSRGIRLPIDTFFRSLALDQKEKAIAIILSGTGNDGTLGVRAIKGEGGLVIVQEPRTAKYPGMPKSAIITGLVDFVLPVEKMSKKLADYFSLAFVQTEVKVEVIAPEAFDYLERVFVLLQNQTDHDFSYYKQNTIRRRIDRRMAINQISQMSEYVNYLERHSLEVETLFRELLIGVTSFFRDAEAFELLKTRMIPALFENRNSEQILRIWVAGCATGEEAYSIAILLYEYMSQLNNKRFKVQIFATDIDHETIEKARTGCYPDGIAADMPPEYLDLYFTKKDDNYCIIKPIRDMIIFAPQSIIKDPPFSRLDLISCRNLLIYLNTAMQKKVFPIFHYALNPEGFLFLGSSETLGEYTDFFDTIDRKWKLFQRKTWTGPDVTMLNFSTPLTVENPAKVVHKTTKKVKHVSYQTLIKEILLKDYTPSATIINGNGDILFSHGRVGKYLELAPGEASLNIFTMARQSLKLELTTAVRKAINQKEVVTYKGLAVSINGTIQLINLTIRPVWEVVEEKELMLVIFDDVSDFRAEEAAPTADISQEDLLVTTLEQELRSTKEYLQTTIEELETSNEELKSTNEELQSANEELQSTNEELETSKEELQSVNEELVTVNVEHQNKIDSLSVVNNDLNNLLVSTEIATIFLDNRLCIKRFTPAATNVINLIQTDINRPLAHISTNLSYAKMVDDSAEVLKTLVFKQLDVQTNDGYWYIMRIVPYRTFENMIDGVVITFIDITKQKLAEEALRVSEEKLRGIVENVNIFICTIDRQGTLLYINRVLPELSMEEVIGSSVYDYISPEHHDVARNRFEQVFETGKTSTFNTIGLGAKDTQVWYSSQVAPIKQGDEVVAVTVIAIDVTETQEKEIALQQENEALKEQLAALRVGN